MNWTHDEWAAFGSVLSGAGTVLGAATVLIAAILGSKTYDSWRRQRLSERRIEQAERILTATYKARRGLSMVRSIMMLPHEIDAAEESLKASGEWDKIIGGQNEQHKFAVAQAYYNRLNSTKDVRLALEECQPMARALFGERLETAIETLNRQFGTVQIYVDANLRERATGQSDLRKKINEAIFQGFPSADENEMDKTIADQVKVIEDICVPVLQLGASNLVPTSKAAGQQHKYGPFK